MAAFFAGFLAAFLAGALTAFLAAFLAGFLAAFLAGFFAAFFAAIAVSPRVLVVPHNAGKPHTDGPAGMLHAHWFVIAMFSAPACVIRQYAGYIWYDVDIPLTIGKRWVNGQNHPCTDEAP